MARHAENCGGEVEDAENGTPTPKKGRRGRKRKMRSRKDEDDSGKNLRSDGNVGISLSAVIHLSDVCLGCISVLQRKIMLNQTRRRRRRRGRLKKNHHCCRKKKRRRKT